MSNKIGVKGGRRDLKLFFQNKIRRKKKEIQEQKLQKEKEEQEKRKKETTLIQKEEKVIKQKKMTDSNLVEPIIRPTPSIEIIEEKENSGKENKNTKITLENSIDIKNSQDDKEKKINDNTRKETQQLEPINSFKKKKGKNSRLKENFDISSYDNLENTEKETQEEKENSSKENKNTKITLENSIDIENSQEDTEKQINDNTQKEIQQLDLIISSEKKKGKNSKLNIPLNDNLENTEKETQEELNYIEAQIVKIIDQEIEDKKFKLKKMDSEIYTIQRNVEAVTNESEMLELERQIQELLEKIERIKKQITSLEKTLDLKFPIDNPDNYLIYLTEEYKNKRKEEINLGTELRKDLEFKSIIDTLIEIEEAQEKVEQKLQDKKENMQLDQEKIEKLQDDMIDIEDINQKIKKMLEQNKKALKDITSKVNETVKITEKVNHITKQTNHSLLELFLLMSLFKRNLSIKNSAIATATAAIALDMILKITTPIQEKQVVKSIKITDYKNMIEHCLSDTDFLENMIRQNLSEIASLRFTFEHDYQSCSYLSSYQETLEKFTKLEENMKEHQTNVTRMKKEMEYQLDKNNDKVKKYDSINT